jgi:uncharacterized protein YjbJ (UPF0337 family)
MSEGTRDKVEGSVDELKGRGKEAVGKVTGDERTQAEGKLDQVKGNMQQGLGELKDKAGEAVDNLTGNR